MDDLVGSSGTSFGGKGRSPRQRLDAFAGAIERGNAMLERIKAANGDAPALAMLMAESIAMWRASRGLDVVGKDGRQALSMDTLQASYCCDSARAAYLLAVRANQPT